jgi:arginine exporter protein ArgO
MVRSKSFGKATAYIGIVNSVFALGIIIPIFVIRAVFGLGATVVGTIWFILLAQGFFRLGKEVD